jgi:hypothetical protein
VNLGRNGPDNSIAIQKHFLLFMINIILTALGTGRVMLAAVILGIWACASRKGAQGGSSSPKMKMN